MQIYAMVIKDDIAFELPVSFFMGKLKKVSPKGRIPVFDMGDGVISVSEVISEYLDDMYSEKSMAGEKPRQRAEARYFRGLLTCI